MNYTCKNCGKVFQRKHNYDLHTKRKNPCINNLPITQQSTHNTSVSKQNLISDTILSGKDDKPDKIRYDGKNDKHYVTSDAVSSDDDQDFINQIALLKSLVDGMYNYSLVPKEKKDKDVIVDQMIFLNNIMDKSGRCSEDNEHHVIIKEIIEREQKERTIKKTNEELELVAFGLENLNVLPFEEIMNAWKKGIDCVLYLMYILYHSDLYPQYHNCDVANPQKKHTTIFDGEKWVTREMNEVIDEVSYRILDFLVDKYKEAVHKGIRVLEFEAAMTA